jgi:hypothetical protein
MRIALLLALFSLYTLADAASLNGCDTSWRLGNQVIHVGDDVGQTLKTLDRSRHRLHWLRGPSSNKWSLVTRGQNSRTVHIRIQDGRVGELCQYSH